MTVKGRWGTNRQQYCGIYRDMMGNTNSDRVLAKSPFLGFVAQNVAHPLSILSVNLPGWSEMCDVMTLCLPRRNLKVQISAALMPSSGWFPLYNPLYIHVYYYIYNYIYIIIYIYMYTYTWSFWVISRLFYSRSNLICQNGRHLTWQQTRLSFAKEGDSI